MSKSIVIAERDNIAAVLENEKVIEFFVHRGDVLLGDVYLSKVDNVLPSIDAAFVNVGGDKMGFLHAQDIVGKGSLKDKVRPNQNLIVQVVKEPTGHKGPRVTTEISIPGRFLVLIPQETGINISRKISSAKERARLKSVVSLLKPVGVGVIVRTEAENQAESEIQDDLEMLLEKWNSIISASETHTAPSILHRDQDLLYRVIREACSEDVTQITVDTPFAYQRASQLLQSWNLNKNIELISYKGTQPLLVASGIQREIKAALQTKVNMPSGGYLYIQTTEALTVIDVNSGKFTSSSTQDETILRTNIEAVKEIARQLKLRNIGGMIIIDFIDMNRRTDKLAVMQELELVLDDDKSKPQLGQLSDLGLVELTRHRQGQSLFELFTKKCPHCQGTGCIVEEFNFSSSLSDGEYRAKAAKIKLPNGQAKPRSNNENKKFNRPQHKPAQGQVQPQPQTGEQSESKSQEPIIATPIEAVEVVAVVEGTAKFAEKTSEKTVEKLVENAVEQAAPQEGEQTPKAEPVKTRRPQRGRGRKPMARPAASKASEQAPETAVEENKKSVVKDENEEK